MINSEIIPNVPSGNTSSSPAIAALISMAEVETTGKALANFRYSDFVRKFPELESATEISSKVRIAILRSCTVEAIEPVLRYHAMLDGIGTEMFFGGYNQYAQEILDPSSDLYRFQPQFVVMMVRLEESLPEFFQKFESQTSDEWETGLERVADELRQLTVHLMARCNCQVLVQNAMYPVGSSPTISDAQNSHNRVALVHRFNASLVEKLGAVSGASIWDFASLVNRIGYSQIYDARMWYLSKNPYRLSAYPAFAADLQRYLRALQSAVKKCIVLDLDDTLWGGVVGEEGLGGIELGHTYPGNCYRDFQSNLLKCFRQGIILAINSKNNEADALDAIENHPDMILRKEHFATWRINWQDKASNLRSIAAELNIGLDSMLMIDDNEVECELIRQQLPQVDVYCLPAEAHFIPEIINEVVGLEKVNLTSEDRQKGEMYRAQAARKEEESGFSDLDEFLASLELRVTIQELREFLVPRVAQLTQKTNQFNMTTRRYSEAEIAAMTSDERKQVLAVSVQDRFGEYGVVGVVILVYTEESCRIESFLLSCRVIGRRIEDAVIAQVAEITRSRNMNYLHGEFIPSAKNVPASDVYKRLGFETEDATNFVADLRQANFEIPSFIELSVITAHES